MIEKNTGNGKNNYPVDVVVLQLLFNQVTIYQSTSAQGAVTYDLVQTKDSVALAKLTVDGSNATDLTKRIEIYQQAKKMTVVDGWISKGGGTLKALLTDAGIVATTGRMAYIRSKIISPCGVSSIKVDKCITLYEKQYSTLSADDKDGMRYILKTAKADADVTSIPEFAYMLATTKHETAHTFRAIAEYGKGSGHDYGKEISVTDTATKKVYKNKYYGRGYVQVTWGYNYQKLDEKLGNGTYPNKTKTKMDDYNKGFTISNALDSIYLNPEKALDKENAYVGMVWGMQKGVYTGKKVSSYISTAKIDYTNARRVINGTDMAATIAGYAEAFEIILLTSTL